MEAAVRAIAGFVAAGCEMAAVGLVAAGALEALGRLALGWRTFGDLQSKRRIWLRFAAALVLALEFALAADLARTVIAPTWRDIGQLAAVAAIRTLLSLFLGRDLEFYADKADQGAPNRRSRPPRTGSAPPRSAPAGRRR